MGPLSPCVSPYTLLAVLVTGLCAGIWSGLGFVLAVTFYDPQLSALSLGEWAWQLPLLLCLLAVAIASAWRALR